MTTLDVQRERPMKGTRIARALDLKRRTKERAARASLANVVPRLERFVRALRLVSRELDTLAGRWS